MLMIKDKTLSLFGQLKIPFSNGMTIKKLLDGKKKLNEANQIAKHFSKYMAPVVADGIDLKEKAYSIRHQVYCEELGFEPVKDSGLEQDEFDAHSIHCLLKHGSSGAFAGTVRLVRPQQPDELLPIEKYCIDSIEDKTLHPGNFERHEICEISRLAVPKHFRRRLIDDYDGAATGVLNLESYSEAELRCFPFISVGLYLSAASVVIQRDIKHTFVIMEPRLARSMSHVGIKFTQIGPVVDYHGRRAPFYINPSLLRKSLRPNFLLMLDNIAEQLA